MNSSQLKLGENDIAEKLAADQRHPDGLYWMGLCYLQGHGVPTDSIRGLSLLESAASLGVAAARDKIQGQQDT